MNIRDVAALAQLELTNEEADRYELEIGAILSFIEPLKQAEVEGVEPTIFADLIFDAVREDIVGTEGLTQDAALMNAPAVAHDQFRLPKVVE